MTDGNPYIKKANTEQEYTPEQLLEMKKCAQDATYFINTYVKIQHPVKGLVHFKLFDYQKKVIKMLVTGEDGMLLFSRQSGKTTTTMAYFLWFAAFHFDKTILIVSDKNDNAQEFIHKIRIAYENLPMWLKPGVTSDGWNKHSVGFDNGSRIRSQATTEKSGRGLSISLLFCDEFAFVRDTIQEKFWTSISPTLATGGQCIISSTPNGDSNLFAQLWRGAELDSNGFKSLKILWNQVPGRDAVWKKKELGRIGETKFKQEHECEFLSSDPLLISSLILQQIKVFAHINEIKEFKFWGEIEKGKTYIVGVDPSTGTGSDFSVIEIFEFPNMEQIAEFRSNTTSSPFLYKALKAILKLIENNGAKVYYSVENNGVGEGVIALFENDDNAPDYAEFISEEGGKRLGMTTTNKTKMKACLSFKEMVEAGTFTVKSNFLLAEMKNFIRKGNSYEAKLGATDDCVSASLIVTRVLQEIMLYEDAAFELFHKGLEEDYFGESEMNGPGYNPDSLEDAPLPMI